MIIIVVMGVLVILMTLITNLTADATHATQMMATIRAQDQAYYVAQSAVRAVLPLLPNSSDAAHSLQDPWAIGAPPLEIDAFMVVVKITDEERFINPNAMMEPGGQINEDQVKLFRRLLKLLGQRDDEIINPILDWLDPDSNRRLPGGAEGQDYGERLPKNAPLDTIDEVLQIKGIPSTLLREPSAATPTPGGAATASPVAGQSPPDLRGFQSGGTVQHGLGPLISVHASGKVNVNTAPPLVLQALAENLDQGLVNAIVDRRNRTPFEKLDDLLEVPGVTRDHLYFIKKVADVKSSTWQIRADVGPATGASTLEAPPDVTLIARYRGDGRGIQALTWNLEDSGSEDLQETPGSGSSRRSLSPTSSPSSQGSGRTTSPAANTNGTSTTRTPQRF